MPRIRKPPKEKTMSFLRRTGWLFLAVLFVVTALGVGVAAFWQATHQPKDNTSQTTPSPASNSCSLGEEKNLETLPAPDVFKETSKVSQLQTTDLQVGTGQAAKSGDCLVMK